MGISLHGSAASVLVALVLGCLGAAAMAAEPTTQEVHDRLVARLKALEGKAGAFGPVYEPLYRAMLPWYAEFGAKLDPADTWMVSPEQYAAELADALENGKNFIAENPGAGFPMFFEAKLADGRTAKANYILNLAEGFPQDGKKFPLIVGLHGSGWLGHRISYSRGGKTGGRTFGVTPIQQRGPWQIDFLNAYLDELIKILPIDPDRVYLEGHSLGAMAVWDWAMENPERFAAISPRAGASSMFRAARLKNVPVWVVHGSLDETVLPAYADQMVSALRAAGASNVKYSLLKGAPHNVPADFDQKAVIDWYLQQTRSHEPVPADPIKGLGIGESGFSEMAAVTLPAGEYYKSAEMQRPDRPVRSPDAPRMTDAEREKLAKLEAPIRDAEKAFYKKIEDQGELVDSVVFEQMNPGKHTTTLWLAVPKAMLTKPMDDKSVVALPQRQGVRFYARGDAKAAMDHLKQVTDKLKSEGRTVSDEVWVTPLTPWRRGTSNIAEYFVEVK